MISVVLYQDAVEYHDLFIKQIGVDCHATCLNTGKFLAIQGAVAEKNRKKSKESCEAKFSLSKETESCRDPDCDDTLERAKQAEINLKRARANFIQSDAKVVKNKKERDNIKHTIERVLFILRDKSPSSREAAVVVDKLPDLETFRPVSSFEHYRAYRSDLAVSQLRAARSHTLEELEVYELYFETRFHGGEVGTVFEFCYHVVSFTSFIFI